MQGVVNIDKILVINLANIGDVVIASPLVRALGESYPGATIHLLTTPRTASIAGCMPCVDQIITYDKFGTDNGLRNFFAIGAKLRKEHYQLAISCNQSVRSTILTALSGAPRRIGFDAQFGRFFLTNPVKAVTDEAADAHMSEILLRLLLPLGIRSTNSQLELSIDGRGAIPLPPDGKSEIVLCPFSRGPEKDWTIEECVALVKEFSSQYQLYLIGGPKERDKLEAINRYAGGKAIILAGRYELGEIAKLIKRAALTISVDTGPAHIAEAIGAHLLVLFGFDNSAVWGPRKSTSKIISANIGCDVCETKRCSQRYRCMTEIGAPFVIAEARKMLE